MDQAAERLGCEPDFVRRLIRERRITYQKRGPGKRSPVRIREDVVDAFIDASTVEAIAAPDMPTVSTRRPRTQRDGDAYAGGAASRPRLLTVDQAAERLDCEPDFVRRLIKERRITYQKYGPGKRSPVRIREDVVDAFIEASTVEADT